MLEKCVQKERLSALHNKLRWGLGLVVVAAGLAVSLNGEKSLGEPALSLARLRDSATMALGLVAARLAPSPGLKAALDDTAAPPTLTDTAETRDDSTADLSGAHSARRAAGTGGDALAPLPRSGHPAMREARLGEEDVARYRRILALQTEENFEAANREIARLGDRRLLGHVHQQRLLHPGGYRAGYDELRHWLSQYRDLPGADRVYALALARQPKGAPPPPEPLEVERPQGGLEETAARNGHEVVPRSRQGALKRPDGPASERIEELLHAGKLGAALKVLGDNVLTRKLKTDQYDLLRTRIAEALFYNGSPRAAETLAGASAERSGDAVPSAHWIAGLAHWRLGRPAKAGAHFEAMAENPTVSPAEAAAAAFWAGRSAERTGQPARAQRWLDRAARYDRTFYGLLAARLLGRPSSFQWEVPTLTPRHLAAIAETAPGSRALALLQIGERDLAEQELRRVSPRRNRLLAEALIALAEEAGLAALALQVGNLVPAPDGGVYDSALFPLPHWEPAEGFSVDRALLFAVMRQESRFESRLVSRAGATGLMQIMPETANDMVLGGDYAGTDRRRLFDPAWNLGLGQRYLASLLGQTQIGGNLFLAAAAYNAGPANLTRWRKELEDVTDPLLFIESIPMRETRDYVHKVLVNYWVYQMRLGRTPETLDAVATGSWPVYLPADGQAPTQVATSEGG